MDTTNTKATKLAPGADVSQPALWAPSGRERSGVVISVDGSTTRVKWNGERVITRVSTVTLAAK